MYKVIVFYRYGYDYMTQTFNLLSDAEEYYDSIADEIEYEGYSFRMVVLYHNRKKLKEFKA